MRKGDASDTCFVEGNDTNQQEDKTQNDRASILRGMPVNVLTGSFFAQSGELSESNGSLIRLNQQCPRLSPCGLLGTCYSLNEGSAIARRSGQHNVLFRTRSSNDVPHQRKTRWHYNVPVWTSATAVHTSQSSRRYPSGR
jgi:hypothetical protein